GARADARDAQLAQLEHAREIADPAGSLDLHVRRSVVQHQLEILARGSRGSEAGGGLDPIDLEVRADFTERELVRALQVAVLENDLQLAACAMRELQHRGNFGPDVAVL